MKFFSSVPVVLAFAFALSVTDAAREDFKLTGFIENQINKTLEALRAKIPEPIDIDKLDLVLPGGVLDGYYNASDIHVTGVNRFQTSKLHFNLFQFKLDIGILFDHINLYFKYGSDMILGQLIPFYGDGKVNVHISNLNVSASGKFNVSAKSITNLTIDLGLDDALFDLHGMINNEEFSSVASALLTDVVPAFINDHKALITRVLSPIAEKLINGLLAQPKEPTEEF